MRGMDDGIHPYGEVFDEDPGEYNSEDERDYGDNEEHSDEEFE